MGFLLCLILICSCTSGTQMPTIPESTISQTFGHLGHVGVDFNVNVGTPVYAVMDGLVVGSVQDSRVYGRYVMVLHCDGYMSLYAHLSETKVRFGVEVKAGELIGLSGGDPHDKIDGDGWSSGSHLHFEVRVPGHLDNNLYNCDPMEYLENNKWDIPAQELEYRYSKLHEFVVY